MKISHDASAANPLVTAQVGVGGFGWQRRQWMNETGMFRLVGIHDRNHDAAIEAAAESGARIVESYEALLELDGLEAVVISTGADSHAELAIAAMERGLHVFVEKPLCCSTREVDAVLSAQHASGVVVGVGHNSIGATAHSRKIKSMIDAGGLGIITAVEKTTAHNGGFMIRKDDWRGVGGKNPGGMLFQCGVHAIHELMYFFGPIVEVSSFMRYDVHTTASADAAVCLLRFESGLIGTLTAYHTTPYRHSMKILGTKAIIRQSERFFDEGTVITIQESNLDNRKQEIVPLFESAVPDYTAGLRSFVHAVRHGGTPTPSLIDGARAVLVVFAAEESAKTGRAVPVLGAGSGRGESQELYTPQCDGTTAVPLER